MGCEFALPFVFSPYFADTYGGKDGCLLSTCLIGLSNNLDKWEIIIQIM